MSETTDKKEMQDKPRPRLWLKRCAWVLLILVLILGICGVILNGVGSRWIIEKQLHQFAEGQDLEGDFTLDGSMLSGYTISDLVLTGEAGVKRLEVGELKVSYSLSKLLDKELDAIEVDRVVLVADLDDFLIVEKKDEESTDVKELLATLRPILTAPEISIADVDVKLKKSGEEWLAFQWGEFEHAAGSEDFNLLGLGIQEASRGLVVSPQNIGLHWGEQSVAMDRFELLPDIGVRSIVLDWSGELVGEGEVWIGEAVVEARVNEKVSVELKKGELSSTWLEDQLQIKLPASFTVNHLKADLDDYTVPIPQWRIATDIGLKRMVYQEYDLTDVNILLNQEAEAYRGALNGELNTIPLDFNFRGNWTEAETEQWWKHTISHFSLNIKRLEDIPSLWVELPKELTYQGASFQVNGDLSLSDLDIHTLDVKGKLAGVALDQVALPDFDMKMSMKDRAVKFSAIFKELGESTLLTEGDYDLKKHAFSGNIEVSKPNSKWVNAVMKFSGLEMGVEEGMELSWKGKGNVPKTLEELEQTGNLEIKRLGLVLPDKRVVDVVTELDYALPDEVKMKQLEVKFDAWVAEAKLTWAGERLEISSSTLKHREKLVGNLKASIPYSIEIQDLESFLNQEEKWDVEMESEEIAIKQIEAWAGANIPREITGKVKAQMHLFGSPAAPNVKGELVGFELRGIDASLNEPVIVKFGFESLNKALKVKTMVSEQDNELLTLDAEVPFTPLEWAQHPEVIETMFRDTPLKGKLKVNELPLNRISAYVPELEELDGEVSAEGVFSGSLNAPKYQLDVYASLPKIVIKDYEVERVREVKLKSTITEDLVISSAVEAQINGGKLTINGDVDISDLEVPQFDLRLKCDYAQVYRNDFLSSRANVNINLKGTLEDALVSGDVGIVESLFYKDIELIPIGVPSSEVAEVKLPSVDTGSGDELPIPAPFDQWRLDVNVKTEDPFLIRGNVARGKVEGGLNVSGTLKNPVAKGKFHLKKIKAKLPFSVLRVANGEVIFDESTGLMNPRLKVAGTSEIGNYKVNLLVHGNVSSPGTSLTSSPPLPEEDIMSLLATGATTSDLENSNTVALKALQVFLMKLENEEKVSGANKLFGALLSGMQKLNLEVGKEDVFTGSKYTSASVDIGSNWLFTTQVDAELETRALIVYLIRFR